MRSVASAVLVGLVFFACGGSTPPQADTVDPVCRKAESIAPGTRLAAATDESSPRFAVKVRGPGEIGVAGFVNEHNVMIIDLATGQVAARTAAPACKASYLALPTAAGGYGEYCVVLEPLKRQGYSTFDLAFAAQPHAREDAGTDDSTARLCGAR